MRKIIAGILIALLICPMIVSADFSFAGGISDTDGNLHSIPTDLFKESMTEEEMETALNDWINSQNIDVKVNEPDPDTWVKSFSDVPEDTWYYDNVMKMTRRGLFKGTTPLVNGVGTFSPDAPMTKAEFLTVVMRVIYPDKTAKGTPGSEWWSNSYLLALEQELFMEPDLPPATLDDPMKREEMAFVLMAGLNEAGIFGTEEDYQRGIAAEVKDWDDIMGYYFHEVVYSYAKGLLLGDDNGFFNPKDSLTRAEAAAVIARMIDAIGIKKSEYNASAQPASYGPITIYEGQERKNRVAMVGDTVIKEDGTRVVLELGPSGVLGEGQGVAPDLGLKEDTYASAIRACGDYMRANMGMISTGGNSIEFYTINPLTGEGHWGSEWTKIDNATHPWLKDPNHKGNENYEVYDNNWIWVGEGRHSNWVQIGSHHEYHDMLKERYGLE